MNRYTAMFNRLDAEKAGALVPFLMLGDPDPETSFAAIAAAIAGGADALELGIPFSDPVADGPTIQRAHLRALANDVDTDTALALLQRIRSAYPELPIGLLVYGNVAFSRGIDTFYGQLAAAGADSILIPDVPVREGAPFREAAAKAGLDQIFIAPPNASTDTLKAVAAASSGYIYAVSRAGVTGTERSAETTGLAGATQQLQEFGGAPALLGFGISTPEHLRAAIASGAAGAITGSAVTQIIAANLDNPAQMQTEIREFVAAMKAATSK